MAAQIEVATQVDMVAVLQEAAAEANAEFSTPAAWR